MIMFLDHVFPLLVLLTQLCRLSTANVVPLEATNTPEGQRLERRISPDLFDSLDELSRIVDIAYCIGTTGVQKPFQCLSHCRDFQGFELIEAWHTGPFLSDSCGYIALSHSPSPKRIIVAFRGTYSLPNAIADLSAIPQEYVPFSVGNGTDDDNAPKCTNCTVHLGFMNAWRSTRDTILETISAARAKYPDYAVTLVGHSLGGAVAALAGTEMKLRGWDATVTTFGEPRVGNKAFVEFLDKTFHLDSENARDWMFRRVTHANDPVPLVPLTEWGYEMHGGEIYISRVELPFSVEDVQYCEGATDRECISGMENGDSDSPSLSDRLLDLIPGRLDAEQQVISDATPQQESESEEDAEAPPQRLELRDTSRLPWNLLPPRFRLWELFYSHRDYFIRLGLCVPGGDPSGTW